MTVFVADYLGVSAEEAWPRREAGFRAHGTTLRWLQQECGLSDPDSFLDYVHPAELERWLKPLPALRPFLESIPLPKAILTNSPLAHAQRVLDFFGIADCFDQVFDLRSNGFLGKPHPESYQRCLEKLAVPASSTVFIDDVPAYLSGFRALGGHCVLVDENPQSGNHGFPAIPSVFALPELVY